PASKSAARAGAAPKSTIDRENRNTNRARIGVLLGGGTGRRGFPLRDDQCATPTSRGRAHETELSPPSTQNASYLALVQLPHTQGKDQSATFSLLSGTYLLQGSARTGPSVFHTILNCPLSSISPM